MDSITQAALGALCGELILGKKLGNKGILWGLLFGTMPDLDILAYPLLSSSEQLGWHRGISHSILMMFVAAAGFGWWLHKLYQNRDIHISYTRAAWFVFLAWSTHVLIDCFNSYGTMILEPFSSQRISINNLFIIDLFFLIPMIIGLTLCLICGRTKPAKRMKIATITSCWLILYFVLSLVTKLLANQHFEQLLIEKGIVTEQIQTAPTFSNIFLWRMIAQDTDGETIHASYWSFFDSKDEQHKVISIKTDHYLEANFRDSKDLQALRRFTGGWHKSYKNPEEPNTLYIAALHMGEMHITTNNGKELRPPFTWKITRTDDGSYTLDRAFKMSKDGYKDASGAIANTFDRVSGKTKHWLPDDAQWTWEQFSK